MSRKHNTSVNKCAHPKGAKKSAFVANTTNTSAVSEAKLSKVTKRFEFLLSQTRFLDSFLKVNTNLVAVKS